MGLEEMGSLRELWVLSVAHLPSLSPLTLPQASFSCWLEVDTVFSTQLLLLIPFAICKHPAAQPCCQEVVRQLPQ